MFQEAALASTMDANRIGYVRLCQLYQAATAASRPKKSGGKGEPVEVRVLLTGVKKRAAEPEVMELTLTGEYVKDLETVRMAKKQFSGKAVDADVALGLVLQAAGCGPGGKVPAGLIRVANNSHVPAKELVAARERTGHVFPYATIDARGHIFDTFRELPELEQTVFVPGQVESSVTVLRNVLAQLGSGAAVPGAELIVRYVDSFLPRAQKEATKADPGDMET